LSAAKQGEANLRRISATKRVLARVCFFPVYFFERYNV